MAKRIRLPGLVDLATVEDKSELRALAADDRLDRGCKLPGTLINRLVMGHAARTLRFDGKPLPTVASRDDPQRAASQALIRARLDPARPLWDDATVAALVAAVRGTKGADAIGPATQQAIGRLFDPHYIGDAESWQAALDLQYLAGDPSVDLADVRTTFIAAALTAGPRVALGRLVVDVGATGRLGWCWVSGHVTAPNTLPGSGSALVASAGGRLGILLPTAAGVSHLRAVVEGGAMIHGLEAEVNGATTAGVAGGYLLFGLGFGEHW